MVIPPLGFQKSRFLANKTHNSKQLVLVELSTCDVDVEGKLETKAQNSIPSQTFMISPLGSMILPHEQ
jgi:hypothetical protein